MKRMGLVFVAILMFLPLAGATPQDQTFTGEIMDSKCAKINGHAEMTKNHEAIHTEKECAIFYVKQGAKFVLFNAITKMTYRLDDQKNLSQFAGTRVTVTGTADGSSKIIHVADVKSSPAESPFPVSDRAH